MEGYADEYIFIWVVPFSKIAEKIKPFDLISDSSIQIIYQIITKVLSKVSL